VVEGLLLPQTDDNYIALPRFDHYNFSVENFTTYSLIMDLNFLMKPSLENDLKIRKAQGMNTVESHIFLLSISGRRLFKFIGLIVELGKIEKSLIMKCSSTGTLSQNQEKQHS
jgi:hypothetical protein